MEKKKAKRTPTATMFPRSRKGGGVTEVHAQEPYGGGNAGEEYGLEVDAEGLDNRLSLAHSVAHVVEHGNEEVNRVGHRQGEDDGGGR